MALKKVRYVRESNKTFGLVKNAEFGHLNEVFDFIHFDPKKPAGFGALKKKLPYFWPHHSKEKTNLSAMPHL